MNMRRSLALMGAATISTLSFGITIDFDDLASGVAVTNQYASATFSSIAGQVNWTENQNLGSSLPNFICTGPDTGGINCVNDTYVDFTSPVKNLNFLSIGANDNGHNADVDVFVNNVYSHTVQVMGDGTPLSPDLVTITGTNITRIEIKNITDAAGLGWDDFNFDVVPEPASMAVLGLGLLAVMRRKR